LQLSACSPEDKILSAFIAQVYMPIHSNLDVCEGEITGHSCEAQQGRRNLYWLVATTQYFVPVVLSSKILLVIT
jgi:hypothetical protein